MKKKTKKKQNTNSTWLRRKEQVESFKGTSPHYNGWWYHEYFKDFLHGGGNK